MDEPVETPADTHSASSEQTNVKETIESILVAFILAFMFRAFIVEAFVIPTGSMAPTLLGAHLRYRCDDCGYLFEVNYSSPDSTGEEISIPDTAKLTRPINGIRDKTYRIHCPNCGYRIPRWNPSDPQNAATNPPVFYGDRILVLKYLYLFQQPRRWDVVVFKSPAQQKLFDFTQNYIKRLIGRPGESVMILDGDIYVSDKGASSLLEDFVVQTKPRWAQEALWRVVYDNDYFPTGLSRVVFNPQKKPSGQDPPFTMPWKPQPGEAGWDFSGKRVLKFDNLSGGATLRFDPDANRYAWPLTDWLAYDISVNQNSNIQADTHDLGGYQPDNHVSDIKLSLYYQRSAGDGPLRLTFDVRSGTPVARTFVAEISGNQAKLKMLDVAGESTDIGSATLRTDCSTPTRVELIHADYRVTLRVADRDVIVSTPAQYSPDVRYLENNYRAREGFPKPRISIAAERQQAEIRHLSLWRDVYYMNRKAAGESNIAIPGRGEALRWATPEAFPQRVMNLGPDEYFVCGDNSLISGDGRYWDEAIDLPVEELQADSGRVPGRFLLGKAFFVYWPAGYKPVANDAVPSIVPNFGRMRFIH